MAGRIFTKKEVYDGITFDSSMECDYYKLLIERESKGEIIGLKIHTPHLLMKGFTTPNGKVHKDLYYESDFEFYDNVENKKRYIDVKGMLLDDFIIKWKLFDRYLLQENAYLEVLKYSKTTGWVEIEQYKKIMKSKKKELVEMKNLMKKQKEQMEKDLKKIKELRNKDKLTIKQSEKLSQLLETYKEYL